MSSKYMAMADATLSKCDATALAKPSISITKRLKMIVLQKTILNENYKR